MDPVGGSSCSPLIWYLMFRMQKYGQYSRFSPAPAWLWLMEANLWWKTTFDEKWPKMKDLDIWRLRPEILYIWRFRSKILFWLKFVQTQFFLLKFSFCNLKEYNLEMWLNVLYHHGNGYRVLLWKNHRPL